MEKSKVKKSKAKKRKEKGWFFKAFVLFGLILIFLIYFVEIRIEKKYGYIDETGKFVIEAQFDYVGDFIEGFADVEINNKCFFIDRTGQPVVNIKCDYCLKKGIFGTRIISKNGKYGLIDKKGKRILESIYDEIESIGTIELPLGESPIVLLWRNNKMGFFNRKTNKLVKCSYNYVSGHSMYWSYSSIAVEKDTGWGIIDFSEKVIVPCIYNSARVFNDEYFICYLKDKSIVFNKKGEIQFSFKEANIEYVKDGVFLLITNCLKGHKLDEIGKEGCKYGLIDKTGKIILEPKYDDISYFNQNGIARVNIGGTWDPFSLRGGQWGFINKKGEVVLEPKYVYIGFFSSDGYARINLSGLESRDRIHGGKWGIIDEHGKIIINPIYDNIVFYSKNGNKKDYYCKGYDKINYFYKGMIWIKKGDKYGVINKKGDVIIPFKFDSFKSFNKKGISVVEVNGKFGYIDEKGKYIIKLSYDHAENFDENGFAIVGYKKSKKPDEFKFGLINRKGKFILKPIFDDIFYNDRYGYVPTRRTRVKDYKFKKVGLVSKDGKLILKTKFNRFHCTQGDYLYVEKGYKKGVINKNTGEVIVKPSRKYIFVPVFGSFGRNYTPRFNDGLIPLGVYKIKINVRYRFFEGNLIFDLRKYFVKLVDDYPFNLYWELYSNTPFFFN